MAMTMTGEVDLPASREVVWAKLNDAEVLKACIPGCEELNKNSDTEFQAVATTKIGPVKARFKGTVQLTDLDPPNGYKISGQGDGGVAGFAKGGATVSLTEKEGGTLLSYNVEAQIGGKLAQLGQRRQEDRRRVLQELCRAGCAALHVIRTRPSGLLTAV
jgi:carbon monoxide dehydrogenase subunit G